MIIGVKCFKGGVGKTTVAANLAAALNCFKKRVLVVDQNPHSPDLPFWFGLDLGSGSREKKGSEQEMYTYKTDLDFMPSTVVEDLPDEGEAYDKFKNKLGSLKYDYVIVDSSPMREDGFFHMIESVLIPTVPEIPSVRGALGMKEEADNRDIEVLGVLANKLRREEHEISLPEMERAFDTSVIETIHRSKLIPQSLGERAPVLYLHPNSRPAIEFKRLAATVLGKKYTPSLKARIKSKLWKK